MLLFYFDRLSIRNQAKSDLIQIIQVAGVQILLGYDYVIEVDRCIFFPNLIHQWTIKLVWNVDMTLMIGIFFVVWILDSHINITIRNWDWVLRFLLSKLLAMMMFVGVLLTDISSGLFHASTSDLQSRQRNRFALADGWFQGRLDMMTQHWETLRKS